MTLSAFRDFIRRGIHDVLPPPYHYDDSVNHAPVRKFHTYDDPAYPKKWKGKDTRLALENALRYFPAEHHDTLAREFLHELNSYGHIYMYRFMPPFTIKARPIDDYPAQCRQAAAIMLMIDNNLDPDNAQHPHELVTYGGNGSVFQNWAQYLLVMQYLSKMTEDQTLVIYSGHPLGLFPSHPDAPRVVITNGMMIPNHSTGDDLNRFNALGVTQYGQMTAGSFMYIGSQGIVHGTTITVLNAGRMQSPDNRTLKGKLFVTSGLGGMSGAQGKAAVIAGCVGVIAEVDPDAVSKRHRHGWVDEVYSDLHALTERIQSAVKNGEAIALAYHGNVVDLWEKLAEQEIHVDLGSDQTSLHNPYNGGYYPADIDFATAKRMISEQPESFRKAVRETVVRHVNAINKLCERGMYFFDYGNAFLKFARDEARANILTPDGEFRYPSYVQDILGPLCFDLGFGPFRWVCTSGNPEDLQTTDRIAAEVLEAMLHKAPALIRTQLIDNLHWIREAGNNKLVVGSQARILYADSEGRIAIARAFNRAIRDKVISAPVVLGRDHHDVSGTDSPYRETSNIYDGSAFTADMAVHNFIGDGFRGATWVSLHNGGGVGWGEVINGGFGLVLDGSDDADRRLEAMLFWDVNNGIARRAWARNPNALEAIKHAMLNSRGLEVTLPNLVNPEIIDTLQE